MKHKNSLILGLSLLSILLLVTGLLFYKRLNFKFPDLTRTNQKNSQIYTPTVSENIQPDTASATFIKNYTISDKPIFKINTKDKVVVFTFDCESSINSLDTLLSTLKKYNFKASFFVTGIWANKYSKYIKEFNSNGYDIFNHTYDHTRLTTLTDEQIKEELNQTDSIVKGIDGVGVMPFYRPPYDATSRHVREVAASIGYQEANWSLDPLDLQESNGMTDDAVKNRIYSNLKPGEIYLMHISDNITGRIIDEVFKYLTNKGYIVMSLSNALNKYK